MKKIFTKNDIRYEENLYLILMKLFKHEQKEAYDFDCLKVVFY